MKAALLLCSLCFFPMGVAAQNTAVQEHGKGISRSEYNFITRFHGQAWYNAGVKQHGVIPMTFGLRLDYEVVPRLSAGFQYETVMGIVPLGETNDPDKVYLSPTIGAGLSYRLLGGKEYLRVGRSTPGLDVSLYAGGSVGNVAWKQTFSDLRFTLYQRGTRYACSPMMHVGYRFTHSRSLGMPDMHIFYVGVGFRL